ncbi:alpha/beta hydrolase fold domain-containing protein [Sarocladium implicatum]|nr:alpha/beta hydrolase fold domain-containing protein [Sarocladium implicatum]
MPVTLPELKELAFATAPELHPSWVRAEEVLRKAIDPGKPPLEPLVRQPIYAQECRDLYASVTAPGTRDHDLSQGIQRREFTVPSSVDGFAIPVLQLDLASDEATEAQDAEQKPELIVVYYHGGGLHVGEADSEEHSCRRIVKGSPQRVRLYSIGYRLRPRYSARLCVSDARNGFNALRSDKIKTIVVGSSSGGQLAASVAQKAPKGSIHGLLLRCPATCDPTENKRNVPETLRPFHTSRHPSFATFIFDKSKGSVVPRAELENVPLEASKKEFQNYPRTWIQLCSNDNLYSDGLCLAMALVDSGVEVDVDVWKGWPHTFWLRTPHLQEAFDADQSMLKGLRWLLS